MSVEMKYVESSNISAIGWEYDELYVEFKSGSVYLYEGVPQQEYLDFVNAESLGKYFNKHIKNSYEFVQI